MVEIEFELQQSVIISDEQHDWYGSSGVITMIDCDIITVDINFGGALIDVTAEQIEPYDDDQEERAFEDESPYRQFLDSVVDDAEYGAYLEHIHTPTASEY